MTDKKSNQLHGKKVEDIIKSTFPGSSDYQRTSTSKFDIEGRFDKLLNLDTSIKTSKKDSIELADARRFWQLNQKFRLIVATYKQVGNKKNFNKIYEIVFTPEMLQELRGSISFDTVNDFHNKLLTFPEGQHTQAREFAKNHKNELYANNTSSICLNPKIDSKTQRRLQCSLSLKHILDNYPQSYTVYEDTFRDIVLPIVIVSETRKFNKK